MRDKNILTKITGILKEYEKEKIGSKDETH